MMPEFEVLLPLPRQNRSGKLRGAARDAEAARLRALGWSLTEIAERLDFYNPVQAGASIRRALANTTRIARDEQRLLELQSLDECERALWVKIRAQHILVSNGHIIRGDDEQPIEDSRFLLEAIDRILRVKESRRKLLGLDAPARSEVLTIDSVEAEIAKLERELHQA
jgi:hypothetical protein